MKLFANATMTGGYGFGSNWHVNVTVWLTSTSFEGLTVSVIPAGTKIVMQIKR